MKLIRIFILSFLLILSFIFNWNCSDENTLNSNKNETLQTDGSCTHFVHITQPCCVNLTTVFVQVHDPSTMNVVAYGYSDANGEFGWKSNLTTYTVYAWQRCGDVTCAGHELNIFIDCGQTINMPLDD